MRYTNWLLLLSVLSAGCGEARFTSFSSIEASYAVDSSFSLYHSYGDSITAGSGLADPASEAYPSLVASHNSLVLSNDARGGDQACDVPTRQIFPHNDNPTLAQKTLYSLLVSTNDVGAKGAGAYQRTFNLCHQATIAWLAVPKEWKVPASSAVTSTVGASHLETDNNWNAMFTDAYGASVSIPFSHSTEGSVYVWYRLIDDNSGSFQYSLDGNAMGWVSTQPSPLMATRNGSTNSLALLRLENIPSGNHILTFKQISAGADGMGIVAIGVPLSTTAVTLPRVLVGTTPLQRSDGSGPCSHQTAPCVAYVADIRANVALFQKDGLNVQLFESRKYQSATPADMIDSVHPNRLGNLELFQALEDVLQQP